MILPSLSRKRRVSLKDAERKEVQEKFSCLGIRGGP
jgi:hypothetical protein